ncbi:MAG: CHAP domain-containing protein, partial [Lachnospiraceae bacterium]|nr:CHAP domain-containing protein [Lachnospiraceae bacterium]
QFKYSQYYGGNYTPKAGDLVFYTENYGTLSCHVGMITGAPVNGYLQTVEGNILCSDGNWKVVRFTNNAKRTVSNSYVLGYVTPNY